MCGIAGIINFQDSGAPSNEIGKMTDLMGHRGPDGQGFFCDSGVALGHRRLAIVDLSPLGHQPMPNASKRFWIVFNGEIYNHIELRLELEGIGYSFVSGTDTEVILNAHEEWGIDCLNKFNGMWAFAIWDNKKKELFCSRDRFGVKPFYYFVDKKKFVFASEIKPILGHIPSVIANDKLIYDFLCCGMIDHTDETFFDNVKKISPGTWMTVSRDGDIATGRYWDFSVSDKIDFPRNYSSNYSSDFRDLFFDAVDIRLRSDVPVGSCLSGGLDSSSVVCAISKILGKRGVKSIGKIQKTFSSCFADKKFDEREYIEEVIKLTGAEKNEIFPMGEDFVKEFHKIMWHQEEPFLGTGIFAQWRVFKMAREKNVIVLLDGQGSDEYLCGYRKFYLFYLRKLLIEKKYLDFANESIRFFSSTEILKTLNIKKGLRYFDWGKKMLKLDNFLALQFKNNFLNRKIDFGFNENLGERIKSDLTRWSLPVLLRYADKNSMAHSLEARFPFLDYRLIEQAAKLPLNSKMKNGVNKALLRDAMRAVLPDKVRNRKSKLGFSTPEDEWMRQIMIKNIKATFEKCSFIDRYANMPNIIKECDRICSGSMLNSGIIFRFYVLEIWASIFFDNDWRNI